MHRPDRPGAAMPRSAAARRRFGWTSRSVTPTLISVRPAAGGLVRALAPQTAPPDVPDVLQISASKSFSRSPQPLAEPGA